MTSKYYKEGYEAFDKETKVYSEDYCPYWIEFEFSW